MKSSHSFVLAEAVKCPLSWCWPRIVSLLPHSAGNWVVALATLEKLRHLGHMLVRMRVNVLEHFPSKVGRHPLILALGEPGHLFAQLLFGLLHGHCRGRNHGYG